MWVIPSSASLSWSPQGHWRKENGTRERTASKEISLSNYFNCIKWDSHLLIWDTNSGSIATRLTCTAGCWLEWELGVTINNSTCAACSLATEAHKVVNSKEIHHSSNNNKIHKPRTLINYNFQMPAKIKYYTAYFRLQFHKGTNSNYISLTVYIYPVSGAKLSSCSTTWWPLSNWKEGSWKGEEMLHWNENRFNEAAKLLPMQIKEQKVVLSRVNAQQSC